MRVDSAEIALQKAPYQKPGDAIIIHHSDPGHTIMCFCKTAAGAPCTHQHDTKWRSLLTTP